MPEEEKPLGRWKRARYRVEYLGLALAAWLLPKLPYDVLWQLGCFLGRIVFALDARGRSVSLENLRIAFGDRYCLEERECIARESYTCFARNMLCLFWSPAIEGMDVESVNNLVKVSGLDSDPAHGDPKSPGVYFLGHFSNFEWLSLYSARLVNPGFVIAQEFKNPALNPIFDRLRSGTGHQIISRNRAIIRMLKHLRSGGKVGAAADLSVDPKQGGIPIRCFGLWSSGSPMAAILAMREKVPLFLSEIYPEDNGGMRIFYHGRLSLPEEASGREISQACWDCAESVIKKHPELWLWNYKHWRFRPSWDDPKKYPSYSNPSKRFDAVLRDAGIEGP